MPRRPSAPDLVTLWNLEPMRTEHLLFAQTHVASAVGADGKHVAKAILGLLTGDPDSFSDMHRLPMDEVWHFYLGDPIELLLLDPDGGDELILLGHDVLAGQRVQVVVPAGVWMGARVAPGGAYGVFGNTTAPGYEIRDFEGARRDELIARWPHRAELITALTRENAPIRYD